MDTYALHLAIVTLVRASVVTVSAYYMHRKTLTQLLEYAKTVDNHREKDDVSSGDSLRHFKKRRSHARRKGNGYYQRDSAYFPRCYGNLRREGRRGEAYRPDNGSWDSGWAAQPAYASRRKICTCCGYKEKLSGPASPRSSVASATVFESGEASDDEDNMTDNAKVDTTYLHTNGNVGFGAKNPYEFT